MKTSTTNDLPVSPLNVEQEIHVCSNQSGANIITTNDATPTETVESPDLLTQTEFADQDLHEDTNQPVNSLSSVVRESLCRSCPSSRVEQLILDWRMEYQNRHDRSQHLNQTHLSLTNLQLLQ